MPCGYNIFGTQYERVLPASAVANLFPFNYSGKTDKNGFYLGKDKFGTNIMRDTGVTGWNSYVRDTVYDPRFRENSHGIDAARYSVSPLWAMVCAV